jgi:hydrogenase maturation factor
MLRTGKLPSDVLGSLLSRIPHQDPRVLLGPAVGRDAAVIDIGRGRVLVAKTDPVTFAAEDIGWYAVNVNANDIACMGARPSWFMATVLLPVGCSEELPLQILDQMTRAADGLGVELVGGHTEVTAGVDRPIVVGAMLGECAREDLVTGEGMTPGDAVVLCGDIAIEGTALLAKEAVDVLRAAAVDERVLSAARDLLYEPGISVLAASAALVAVEKPRLMHDPTEGGIATALHEMALLAGMTLRIDPTAIGVVEETRIICEALRLDTLGLLASGALLAIMSPDAAAKLGMSNNPSRGRIVGRVEQGPPSVILEPGNTPFPSFDRDELARFFDGMQGSAA